MSERRTIEQLLSALQPLVSLLGPIPLRFVTTFLTVALDEGKGPYFYARVTGMHRAYMSRCLRDIGDRARNGGPGLGLVKIEQDPASVHRRKVFLTEKGRALLLQITRPSRGGPLIAKKALPPQENGVGVTTISNVGCDGATSPP